MICPQCQQERSNYSFYSFRGNQNVAKALFFTRPIEEINGVCFDCAGPYRCLTCGEVKDASEFRLQGRICHSCKSNRPALSDIETNDTCIHVSSENLQYGDWDIKPLTV